MKRIPEALDLLRRAKLLGDYDSNVVGMVAEVVAEDRFHVRKTGVGTKNIDGYWTRLGELRSVQVKGWSSSRVAKNGDATFFTVRAAEHADDLLVLLFYSGEMKYEVLYRGATDRVGQLQASGQHRFVKLAHLANGSKLKRILERCSASHAA